MPAEREALQVEGRGVEHAFAEEDEVAGGQVAAVRGGLHEDPLFTGFGEDGHVGVAGEVVAQGEQDGAAAREDLGKAVGEDVASPFHLGQPPGTPPEALTSKRPSEKRPTTMRSPSPHARRRRRPRGRGFARGRALRREVGDRGDRAPVDRDLLERGALHEAEPSAVRREERVGWRPRSRRRAWPPADRERGRRGRPCPTACRRRRSSDRRETGRTPRSADVGRRAARPERGPAPARSSGFSGAGRRRPTASPPSSRPPRAAPASSRGAREAGRGAAGGGAPGGRGRRAVRSPRPGSAPRAAGAPRRSPGAAASRPSPGSA